MPLTGIGGDYLLHYSDQSPEIWISEGTAQRLANDRPKGFPVSRLGFVFSGLTGQSTLRYADFNRVLEITRDYADVKVVPCFQNNTSDTNHYVVQQGWIDNWLAFVNYYKNDSVGKQFRDRIAALNIFGEPNSELLSDFSSKLALQQRFMSLIKQIHAVDPSMVIIYPFGFLVYDTPAEWFADLTTAGALAEPNLIFDVAHPYFFENVWDAGMTPTQRAQWYADNWIKPCIAKFGASKCWCGETFWWVGLTPSLQTEWMTAIMSQYANLGVGFSIWATIGNVDAWDGTILSYNALSQTTKNILAGDTPPPPLSLPFHDSLTNPAIPNWNKNSGTWNAT